jgi:hypothetical protein
MHPPAKIARCPICGASLAPEPWLCPHCDTPHHRDCAEYFGGCAIFGCRDGHVPQPIEQASWPAAVRALGRVAMARHVQTGSLIVVLAILSMMCPGLVLGLLSTDTARLFLVPLFASACAYGLVDAVFVPGLTRHLNREMGRESLTALELPRHRLHRALPAVRNASARFAWLDRAGIWGIAAGIALLLPLGANSISILFIGVMLRVAADQLRQHLSDIEVTLHRFEATHAPRLPDKPKS